MNKLRISDTLFRGFDKHGISYIHWKSNEHLVPGLMGDTDLDVLVSSSQRTQVENALSELGIKKFEAVKRNCYLGLEDYIGFDSETGKLIHLHLHYKLNVGEKFLKSYELPWLEEELNRLQVDKDTGIKIANSSTEFFHLFLRESLKLRYRDIILALFGKPYPGNNFHKEYEWLLKCYNFDEIKEVFYQRLNIDDVEFVKRLINGPSIWKLISLRLRANKILKKHRHCSSISAFVLRHIREANWFVGAVLKWICQPAKPFRRTKSGEGVVIAFVGVDGAGKSTVIKIIRKWIGWKLDVYYVYFGTGNGPSSILRFPFLWILRFVKFFKKKRDSSRKTHKGRKLNPARFLWALLVAREKERKFRAIEKARSRGMIVVCDRYPQTFQKGFNDGPLLSNLLESKTELLKKLAVWENSVYSKCEAKGPDMLLKLMLSPETARVRKPGMSLEMLGEKAQVIEQMQNRSGGMTHKINCEKSLDEVVLEAKREIWKVLQR